VSCVHRNLNCYPLMSCERLRVDLIVHSDTDSVFAVKESLEARQILTKPRRMDLLCLRHLIFTSLVVQAVDSAISFDLISEQTSRLAYSAIRNFGLIRWLVFRTHVDTKLNQTLACIVEHQCEFAICSVAVVTNCCVSVQTKLDACDMCWTKALMGPLILHLFLLMS